ELEATTARKGNRKVSLTISGWVNESVTFWDDGKESNVYIGTNALEQSRFKFAGKAKIDKDLEAGYNLEIGITSNGSDKWTQDASKNDTSNFKLRKSNWYIKSKTYGKVTVGLEGTSTYHLLDDADGTNTRNYSDAQAATVAMGAFKTVKSATNSYGLAWSEIMRGWDGSTPGQSSRKNIVRYDSPEFGGFVASASWGEDDMWDTSLSYKGELHDFKLIAKVGYGESTDPSATKCGGPEADFKCTWWGAAGTLMHAPTGIYVYGGYGEQTIDSVASGLDDSTTWFVQSGVEKKWNPLGKTTVFGEYRHEAAGAGFSSSNVQVSNSADLDFWAAGVVQNIEAASMDLYVIYRHAEGDYKDTGNTLVDIDDFDMVMSGARIQF
ncbi:MAG: porin, partial [Hyphomicrobium sp.]